MTTEPKFIPNEAVQITLGDNIKFKTRLVDCVGYLVNNALGYLENDVPRMIKTPWFQDEIPFEEAAEIGTKKVITEHSTIGLLVTTDGSFSEIPRTEYIDAEKRCVKELKALNKPFVILLNTNTPNSEYTLSLVESMQKDYEVPVIPTDCANLSLENINEIFKNILFEFPIEQININFPKWINGISTDHWLKKDLLSQIKESFLNIKYLKQIEQSLNKLKENNYIYNTSIDEILLGTGKINITINLLDNLFYKILTEISNINIENESDLFSSITSLANTKKEYDKISCALEEVKQKGYGIVTPSIEELILDEPEMVKQGSRFGVKLKAKAPSIHMIRADIETEVSPIVGSEKQSEELVNYLLSEFESDPKKIWESNIFGKSLHELVNEGLQNKLCKMPEDAREKLRETLERIVNEGSGGLICIIL